VPGVLRVGVGHTPVAIDRFGVAFRSLRSPVAGSTQKVDTASGAAATPATVARSSSLRPVARPSPATVWWLSGLAESPGCSAARRRRRRIGDYFLSLAA
jgi:hypothetical protein